MNTEETISLRVPLKHAEKMRKYLSRDNLLRNDLKFKKDNNFILIPIKKLPKKVDSITFKVVKKKFEKHEVKPKIYKDTIQNSLSEKLQEKLPTSYDIIGDIILIKLSKELQKYKKEVGESLLQSNKNIKTVCLIESVTGEYRIRNIEVIAGEKRTKTIHKEYGLKFHVNIEKTYFSPRLATERKRIASLVKQDEIIVDMFAGVAPFSIMIAKYANPKIIYSLDKNKEAVKYAQQNTKRNNVLDKIEVIHADAKEIYNILNQKNMKADRIIMNLPFSAHSYFSDALKIIADTSIIHYYDIVKEENMQKRLENLKKMAKGNGIVLTNMDVRKIKTYAPREFYICVDITAKKMPM